MEIDGEQVRLNYTFAGQAETEFTKNRVGFCVLHPAECGGSPVEAEHVDGTRVQSSFPRDIAPHQPFLNLRSLTHHPHPGLTARVSLRGDTFEMEDQRNWTDASFKTYCTPLGRPFPVTLRAGEAVRQEIELFVTGLDRRRKVALSEAGAPQLVVAPDEISQRFPELGFGATGLPELESAPSAHRLAALRPAFLRVDLRASQPDCVVQLLAAASEARVAGAGLEVAMHFAPDNAAHELRALADAVAQTHTGAEIHRWLVFSTAEKSTSARTLSVARQALASIAPAAAFFGGTDAYFAELNRCRPPLADCDGVTFSINPQVHAGDDLSMLETLPAQGEVVRNARRFSGHKPVIVSPVTLRPRFNPNATGHVSTGTQPVSPGDPRQRTFFGAFWTLGSFTHLAGAGAAAITYFKTAGAEALHDPSGQPFPIWHLFRSLADFAGGSIVATRSSDPCRLQGVKLLRGNRRRLLVGYLGASPLSTECCKATPPDAVGRVIVAGDDPPVDHTVRDEIPPCSLVEWDWTET